MLRAPFIILWNLLKLISYLIKTSLFRVGHFLTRKKRMWLRLKIPSRQAFGPRPGLTALFQNKRSYLELRESIEGLLLDPRIEGIVVTADSFSAGSGRAADLRALLSRFQTAGKPIIFHTHSIMGRDFDLATAADQVLMTPGGRFYLFGQRSEQFFAAPLLDKLGVAVQFVHIGPFKTAAHRFIHDASTRPLQLMMTQLLEDLSTQQEGQIQEQRNISEVALKSAFSKMPLDDRQALATGLIDARLHRRHIRRWIEAGEDFVDEPDLEESTSDERSPVVIVDALDYADGIPAFRWTPLFRRRRHVATMDLSGMIVMPEMDIPGQSAATIDPEEVLPVLRALSLDPSVAAVVLHINSPGGHALASELLWDGIRRLRSHKPVVAYCSDVAASGGYYMAVAADQIVCHPQTITGSIGVIAGKFSLAGIFTKLGVVHESIERHETSRFESIAEPLSEHVLDNLRQDARSFYRQFLRRVGAARQIPRRRLHRYARGRVYTGRDAHRRHLVDRLGGFDDAFATACELAELPRDMPLGHYPHQKTNLQSLLRASTTTTSLLPQSAQNLRLLHKLMEQDPLLAWMPHDLA